MKPRARRIFIIAGEHSGDQLGGKLMAALKARCDSPILFTGVGGETMEAEGLRSLFPLSDIAVMGPLAILARLPKLVRRVYQAVALALEADLDGVIIIDSPEFTHPVAKRIRRKKPLVPIIDYVSPSIWAWRPGRAKKMRPYVDHVMAILPFEPDEHKKLGGPPCTYVGHPLSEKKGWIDGLDATELFRRLSLDPDKQVLVILPGSRPTEVRRLLQPFGEAAQILAKRVGGIEIILPAVASVRPLIEEGVARWALKPHLIEGESDKFKAFKLAKAALAASGTVTLELGMAGSPMVVAYRVDSLAAQLRFLMKTPSIVLANLVVGENVFPEFIQEDCTPEKLVDALEPLFSDTTERSKQAEGLENLARKMMLTGATPSERAADTALAVIEAGISKRLSVMH